MKIGLQLKKKNHYLRGNNNVQMPPLTPVIEKSFSGILSWGYRYTYVLNNPLKYTDPSGYKFAELPEPMIYYNLGWLKYVGYGWSEDYGGHATIRGIGGGGGYGYRAKYELGGPNPYEWQYDNGDYVNRRTGDRINAGFGADALRAIGLVIAEASVDEVLLALLIIDNKEIINKHEAALDEASMNQLLAEGKHYSMKPGLNFDGDPEKGKMSTALSFALVASAADGPLPFGEAIGIAAVGATAIYLLLTPDINDNYYPGPFYTDRPNNYILPPVPAMNNRNYFPNGNGNDIAKWAVYIGGGATLAKRIYDGFLIDSTDRFNPKDNTYFAPFVTPIPDPSKGY